MRAIAGFAVAMVLLAASSGTVLGQDNRMSVEAVLTGKERPPNIPPNWIGSPTKSAPGWRWDDPGNAGNSVRFFRGDPDNPDVAKREPFVVVVSDGVAVGREGKPIPDAIPEE